MAVSSGCQLMSLAANATDAFDAATEDPVIFDHDAPPIIFDGFFMNEGSKLNAIIYETRHFYRNCPSDVPNDVLIKELELRMCVR